jgi:hypothetical protein
MDTVIFDNVGIYETNCVHKTEQRFTIYITAFEESEVVLLIRSVHHNASASGQPSVLLPLLKTFNNV